MRKEWGQIPSSVSSEVSIIRLLICEIDAINKALNAGDDIQGATMGPVKLNESGRAIPPCSSCREVMKTLGVE